MRTLKLTVLAGIWLHGSANAFDAMSVEEAHRLLGRSIEQLGNSPEYSVCEHGDWADGDGSVIFTWKWILADRSGNGVIAYTDNGTVTRLQIVSPDMPTDRGVRVGDSLAAVKEAYPDSVFEGGSEDSVTGRVRLYAENGNIGFEFRDWNLNRSKTYRVGEPPLMNLKLFWIDFQDGNRFACYNSLIHDREFPCSILSPRYDRSPAETVVTIPDGPGPMPSFPICP